ncbi:MOSC domain-containing protein [Falsihalocynthiibacter sp. SS001]|uniref:MOSC domain-containing protein n=1 Tax=Falsihalocynthiibacter sp. SS001 TaxID=3349698 RepID=UPI0036D3723F
MTLATATLSQIWRHPIKGHGAENLTNVALTAGETLPWDRVWAVPHVNATDDLRGWAHCRNFTRGASYPSLMAINAKLDPQNQIITLSHPELDDLTFDPETEAGQFLKWVAPILPEERPSPIGIVRAAGQGMTDQSKPWVSILNTASLAELSSELGQTLDARRYRGNFWIDGMSPWAERDWLNCEITIGSVTLRVTKHITRCRATDSNPLTGKRDVDTLRALRENWGHQDFGVFAEVLNDGNVAVGDTVKVTS